MKPTRAIAIGTLVVGSLDILDAFVFFGIRSGVAPIRILQSIAAGVLGRASFQSGARAAALGLFLHFVIAFGVVLTYYLVSRVVPALTRRPWVTGPLYGLVVYAVMNFVIVPMSAAGNGTIALPVLPVLINGLLIHAFGVGLPSALAAKAAGGHEKRGRRPRT